VAPPPGRPHGTPVVTRLTPAECLTLLEQAPLGRVGLSIEALPTVRSVRFALNDDDIVIRLHGASRLCRATNGNVVAFHADGYDAVTRRAWSVCVTAVAGRVTDASAVERLAALPLDTWSRDPREDVFVTLSTVGVTGERVELPAPT
jgi:uncharacterized protein